MKISNSRIIFLLLIFRLFTLMTYVPMISQGYEPSVQILGIALSTLVQALLAIPAVFLSSRSELRFGTITLAAYLVFFILTAGASLSHFQRFISSVFLPSGSFFPVILAALAIYIYCAYNGLSSLAKSGSMVFALFAVMLVIMALLSVGEANPENFAGGYGVNIKSAALAFADDLSRSTEVVAFAYLLPKIKSARKSFYGYLSAKTAILAVISLLIISVLGGFTRLTDFPFFTLGSVTGAQARLDALYIIVWTLTSAVRIPLLIYMCADILSVLVPKLKYRFIVSGGLVLIAAFPMIYG